MREIRLESGATCLLVEMRSQGRQQTKIIQLRGSQVARHATHLFERIVDCRNAFAPARAVLCRGRIEAREAQFNRSEQLPDAVVQVARDSAALGFFHLEESCRKRLQPAVGVPQRLLRGAAIGPLKAVVQGAGDDRRKALEPFLHHVIGGARFEALDGAFLSERAGDEDEGDFQSALPQQPKRAQPVEIRKIVVGEDQLEFRAIQRSLEFLPGLHLLPVAFVAGGLQLPYFELGVEGIVLENQEFERRGHASVRWGLGPQYVKFTGGGGVEEDRTPDLRIANATLSQLSYNPTRR